MRSTWRRKFPEFLARKRTRTTRTVAVTAPRQLDTRIGTMYLMEYAEDWPVSQAYLNPKSIQALLLNAA